MPVLSLSHVCVTHVGRPRAGGRTYVRAYRGWCMRATCFCVCMHEGTSEGTKEGREGRAAMTTMGRWFSRRCLFSLYGHAVNTSCCLSVPPLVRWFVGSFVRSLARSLVCWYTRSWYVPSFSRPRHVVFPRSFRPGWYSPRYTGGYSFRSCAHAGIPHRQKQRYSSPPPFQHRSASSSSLPCVRYHSPPSPSLAPHPSRARLPFACVGSLSSSLPFVPCVSLIVAVFSSTLFCILLFSDFRAPKYRNKFFICRTLSSVLILHQCAMRCFAALSSADEDAKNTEVLRTGRFQTFINI